MFSALTIYPSFFNVRADEGDPLSPGVQLDRLSDGASIITDNVYGYQFITPANWYPMSIPSSSDEIGAFNNLAQQKGLPFDEEWISSLPADVLRFVVVDLDSEHYGTDWGGLVGEGFANVTELAPDGLIEPVISLIKVSDNITDAYVTEISDQKVGIVVFGSSTDSDLFFGGKALLFIRNGKVFIVIGETNQRENAFNVTAIIDQMIDSLKFFDVK